MSELTYPHDDERCRQDSVDAEGFRAACRALARISGAAGLPDTGWSVAEVADAVVAHIKTAERDLAARKRNHDVLSRDAARVYHDLADLRTRVAQVEGTLSDWGALASDGDFVSVGDDFAEAIRDHGAWRFARDMRLALAGPQAPAEECATCSGRGVWMDEPCPCATHDPGAASELYRRDFDTEAEARVVLAEHEEIKGHRPWMVQVRGEKVAEACEDGARDANTGAMGAGTTEDEIGRNGTIREGDA